MWRLLEADAIFTLYKLYIISKIDLILINASWLKFELRMNHNSSTFLSVALTCHLNLEFMKFIDMYWSISEEYEITDEASSLLAVNYEFR